MARPNEIAGTSAGSADVIASLILSLFPAKSVVDVGCAEGTWLRRFAEAGITDFLGFDGDYVATERLLIPRDRFRPTDLSKPFEIGRHFDLACSLEVAEHLPPARAESFVSTLTDAAPVVLFSAAIPRQGGTNHINEQWQDYWAEKFERRGFRPLDVVRTRVWGDNRVAWWYQQNAILYCAPERVPEMFRDEPRPKTFNLVHPNMLDVAVSAAVERPLGAQKAIRDLVYSVKKNFRLADVALKGVGQRVIPRARRARVGRPS